MLEALPPITIALAGDSTVAVESGWGPGLRNLLDPKATLVNGAVGGRSSKSFRDEGHWEKVLASEPDWILIQFGHNDQPGKGEYRETDPDTTYTRNLERFVREALDVGARPIIVTSLARRIFGPDGKIISTLGPYVAAAIRVAKAQGVPLVDLHALSMAELNALGPEAGAKYHLAGGKTPDRTHLSPFGCRATGLLVARELAIVAPELREYLEVT